VNIEEILKSPDVAGTAGAILGWLSAPGGTLREQLFNVGAGFGAAFFLAPYMAERAGLESRASQMAFAFVVGLVGMNVLPKLISAAKRADWSALLPAKKGKP
jgi:hypothetical protein